MIGVTWIGSRSSHLLAAEPAAGTADPHGWWQDAAATRCGLTYVGKVYCIPLDVDVPRDVCPGCVAATAQTEELVAGDPGVVKLRCLLGKVTAEGLVALTVALPGTTIALHFVTREELREFCESLGVPR